MTITHIVNQEEYQKVLNSDYYSPLSLKEEGFIHCSKLSQVCKIAEIIYPQEADIMLLLIDTDKLEAKVIWEDLENMNEEYPHIYGPLNTSSIFKVAELKLNKFKKFELPKELKIFI